MKNKAIQKFSPFALGIMVCSYQVIQVPLVYGASLKSVANADTLLKPVVPEVQSLPTEASTGCSLAPAGSTLPTSSAEPPLKASNLDSGLASTGVIASTVTGSVVPSAVVANAPALEPVPLVNADPAANLVAQVPLADDCCEIGGTTTCEVGGLPPQGGGALAGGLSPLLGLLGLGPLAAIPALLGGDGGGGETPTPTPTVPVPEPSSTAAITAGLGLLGLWYGRRFRAAHKTSQ